MSGFLSTRGTLMLDVVFLAMMAIVPMLLVSGFMVRYRRAYTAHKWVQLAMAVILLLAVVAFEIEMRMFGWTQHATASPYWIDGRWNDWIDTSLAIHLCFAIPTPFLWGWLIYRALRRFPRPVSPSSHSREHRFWGRLAMAAMIMTAVTGWWFYWLAFVAV